VPDPPTSLSVTSLIDSGFTASWSAMDNATGYTVKVIRAWDSNETTYYSSTNNITVTGLAYGFLHNVSVCSQNGGGSSAYSSAVQLTTTPATPTIDLYESDSTSITIEATGGSGNYDGIEVFRYDEYSNFIDSKSIVSPATTCQWTALTTGDKFRFKAKAYFTDISSNLLWSVNFSNELLIEVSPRPLNFEWNTAKVSGANFALTYTEWNDFTDRINEFREYSSLAEYIFTAAVLGNEFTAAMFNEAVNNINDMEPTISPPTTKSADDDIYASYLNDLRDSLNSIE
jgi:hypothetical protein